MPQYYAELEPGIMQVYAWGVPNLILSDATEVDALPVLDSCKGVAKARKGLIPFFGTS